MQIHIRLILIGFFSIISFFSFAQNKTYFIDSLSYEQYLKNDIKGLHKTKKIAKKNDISFYYLDMRLGIIEYQHKNYEQALIHFKKAYKRYNYDVNLQMYIYYCYLYTGRTVSSELFANQHPKVLKIVNPKKNNFANSFKQIIVDGGTTFNNQENKDFLNGGIYAENTLQKENYFGELFIKNRLSKRINLYNQFSYIQTNALGVVQSNIEAEHTSNYTNTNLQYVIGLDYTFNKSYTLMATAGYYRESSQSATAKYETTNAKYIYIDNKSQYDSFFGNISLSKKLPYTNIFIRAGVSNFFGEINYLGEGAVKVFPWGNPYYYLNSSFTYMNNNKKNKYVIREDIGIRLHKAVDFGINCSYGDHQKLMTNSGFVVNNTVDNIKLKASAFFIFNIKNIQLIPQYSYIQSNGSYMYMPTTTEIKIEKTKYNNHQILLQCIINL
ncbi:MAG: hypothetical protein IMY73_05200 [Bacteroidetes bacterium]|nr:hypothetical protein [Bacteroidota bacterium]